MHAVEGETVGRGIPQRYAFAIGNQPALPGVRGCGIEAAGHGQGRSGVEREAGTSHIIRIHIAQEGEIPDPVHPPYLTHVMHLKSSIQR